MAASVGRSIREGVREQLRDTYLRAHERVTAQDAIRAGGYSALEPIDCLLGCGQWGIAPRALEALASFDASAVSAYPERFHETLLAPAVLDRFSGLGLSRGQLFFGHGSFNLLERVLLKLLRPGRMLGLGPQFGEIPFEWRTAGGSYEPLPLAAPGYDLPLAALEQALAAEPAPTVVYVDNPNNPLGRHFALEEIERLATAAQGRGTVLLVDEALGDFVDDRLSAARLAATHENVIVTRSLSKALGLAAERVGYAFFSQPLADHYRLVDVPFEPGLVAATLARETLRDRAFLELVRKEAASAKAEIVRACADAGLSVLPSHPGVSILTLHSPARDARQLLRSRGILVQAGSSFGRTHAGFDDSFCRLRVVAGPLVPVLCERIRSLV
jgi:histidinol-phosphate aminotransferase